MYITVIRCTASFVATRDEEACTLVTMDCGSASIPGHIVDLLNFYFLFFIFFSIFKLLLLFFFIYKGFMYISVTRSTVSFVTTRDEEECT